MSLNDFRVGLAGAPSHQLVERQTTPTGCNLAAGDLYSFPNSTSTIDGTVPLTFRWNTRCPGISSKVDLYLYAPSAGGQIKAWTGIDYAEGQFTVQLLPRWWNSTTTALLQVNIVNSGGMSWATTGPPGPVWTVNYPESAMLATTTEGGVIRTVTNSAAATNGGDAIFQSVSNTKQGGISKGAIAAAVIVPIIVIAAVVAVAVRFWRQREAEKRRRWSQALSSTSNLDWEKGARPGDRPGPGNTGSILGRPSMTMSAYGAPGRSSMAASSVFALDNNMAGAGAAGGRPAPPMRSVSNDGASISRSSVMLPNGAVRQSRISFAESTRPDRRSRMSLGNDLRPHSAVFNLKGGSRSATELPLPGSSGLNSAASSVPSTPARAGGGARRAAYATGSAIADDDDADTSGEMEAAGGAAMSSTHLAGGKQRSGRRSMLGLGAPRVVTVGEGEHEGDGSGPTKKDLRSASNASGSADELRELEQAMSYSAYSQPGQYSNPPTPRLDTDNDHTEDLATALPTSASIPAPLSAPAPAHTRPPLVASSSTSTVAYGPDQMLAVYAARARAGEAAHDGADPSGSGSGATSPVPGSVPVSSGSGNGKASTGKKSGLKILTGFGKRHDHGHHGLSPGGVVSSPTSAGPSATGGHEIGQAR